MPVFEITGHAVGVELSGATPAGSGQIDYDRALVMVDGIMGLNEQLARRLDAELIEDAVESTTTPLRTSNGPKPHVPRSAVVSAMRSTPDRADRGMPDG